MRWFSFVLDNALTHLVSEEMLLPFVHNASERGFRMREIPNNPKEITEWAFDMGGSVNMNEPEITINVDGLKIFVRCCIVSDVIREIAALPPRYFADGCGPYFKTKFWLHATILSPEQRDSVLTQLRTLERDTNQRSVAFHREWMAKHNRR